MLAYRHPYIAQEGWLFIGSVLLVNLIVTYSFQNVWAVPGWLLFAFCLMMYRDPVRVIPSLPLALVAPVDGKIISVNIASDPFVEREAWCIGIDMSLLSVYSARSPTEGKVMNQWYGTKHDSSHRAGEVHEPKLTRNGFAQWIQTDEGDDVVMRMQQKHAIQRSRCYVQSGERIGQGQRCGFIPLGATVDVFIPKCSRIDVKVGVRVRAGATVIATLVHQTQNTAVETAAAHVETIAASES